jgi:selenocysteine lyase/cysteine desulfurase
VEHIDITADGRMDLEDFDRKLTLFKDRVELVSITGASNVTGYINPIHDLAEKVHAIGAQMCVDGAQLAPHRAISMLPLSDPRHIDYLSLSAHKMYAPLGTGALVGRKDIFNEGDPDMRGGGEVEIVTLDSVTWSEPPERDEAGSPNVVGAVAMGAAIAQLKKIGMAAVALHEAQLTEHALSRLPSIPGLEIYGNTDPTRAASRLGVIPVNLRGLSHYQVAAILGYEFGIGVRNGCFCAHPYLLRLMKISERDALKIREEMHAGDRRRVPGLVRISFGLYNTKQEVDEVIDALSAIQKGQYSGKYTQEVASGAFVPENWKIDLDSYLPIDLH